MAEILLVPCIIFAVADWVAVARSWKRVEYVAKPATLALLLLYAASAPEPSGWLIAALALSLLGDVYLVLPGDLFVAGLCAFLLAHVAYIVELDASVVARLACLALVLAASSPLAVRLIRSIDDNALRGAVALYMIVIGLMVASALASGSLLASIGALLFFGSDSLIAWNRFVRPFPWAHPAIMVTYHLGQLGLVSALRT